MAGKTMGEIAAGGLLGGHPGFQLGTLGFDRPFVDVDEWRERPRRHRYVHGGFEDTPTRFSFYFPETGYDGRFLQYLEGGAGGRETLLAASQPTAARGRGGGTEPFGAEGWIFDLGFDELGAYLVESNQGYVYGEGAGFADDDQLFNASAESARFAKHLAQRLYGAAPKYGYVFGGSVGGSRAIHCLEDRPDVYQGAVPMAARSGGLLQPWSAAGHWWLHARHKLADIVDATEPGGGGDPFATLTHDQREALAALYRHGYPRGAESQLRPLGLWLWDIAAAAATPYYQDFWNATGYLGRDNPGAIAHLILDKPAKVARVLSLNGLLESEPFGRMGTAGLGSDAAAGVVLDGDFPDPAALFGAKLTFLSGKAEGRSVYVANVAGSILTSSPEMHPQLFDGVEEGDEVHVDNRPFIAWCHLHRHMIEQSQLAIVGGLCAYAVDASWVYPQQPADPATDSVGLGFGCGCGCHVGHAGRFEGKMIQLNGTLDPLVWPTGAVAYNLRVQSIQGDRTDDRYRLWWVENASHGAPEMQGPMSASEKDRGAWRSRLVDYDGVAAQALRDLTRWVEDDTPPRPSIRSHFEYDGRLVTAPGGGVQPRVDMGYLTNIVHTVAVGEEVHFRGQASAPEGAALVYAQWDFEGRGQIDFEQEIDASIKYYDGTYFLRAAYAYSKPGTYFTSLRVGAHGDGATGKGPSAENLVRVRVVVS